VPFRHDRRRDETAHAKDEERGGASKHGDSDVRSRKDSLGTA
jgi:hypothetical protein